MAHTVKELFSKKKDSDRDDKDSSSEKGSVSSLFKKMKSKKK